MNIEDLYALFLGCGISTDTRNIEPGTIFFALKGANFNANKFADEALKKGAKYAVIDEDPIQESDNFIRVKDVLETLQHLANFHRQKLNIPVIGLTGSNGKTTTKELLHAVLSKKYRTTATKGNLNNHIGVPLTLLSMTTETEIGIVEMGANHPGEIQFLCNIAKPNYGYITNFGKAHLEGFGSVEGVIKAKSELYKHVKDHQETLFLNIDDPVQKKQLSYPGHFSFGHSPEADICIEISQDGPNARLKIDGMEITSQLTGQYNGNNMAAAYAMGRFFNVPENLAKEALENYIPSDNRSQVVQKDSVEVILDAYNANPTSMAAAIENLVSMNKSAKAAILGDMFEMGPLAEEEHQMLVDMLEKYELDAIYLIGDQFFKTNSSRKIRKFRTFEDFAASFDPTTVQNTTLLVKGSRGMALERTLALF